MTMCQAESPPPLPTHTHSPMPIYMILSRMLETQCFYYTIIIKVFSYLNVITMHRFLLILCWFIHKRCCLNRLLFQEIFIQIRYHISNFLSTFHSSTSVDFTSSYMIFCYNVHFVTFNTNLNSLRVHTAH